MEQAGSKPVNAPLDVITALADLVAGLSQAEIESTLEV